MKIKNRDELRHHLNQEAYRQMEDLAELRYSKRNHLHVSTYKDSEGTWMIKLHAAPLGNEDPELQKYAEYITAGPSLSKELERLKRERHNEPLEKVYRFIIARILTSEFKDVALQEIQRLDLFNKLENWNSTPY